MTVTALKSGNVVQIKTAKRASYNFDPSFELVVAYLACSMASFLPRLNGFLDAEGFDDANAKLAVQGALAVLKADVSGRGPTSIPIVLQQLRSWMSDGKITLQAIKGVHDALYSVPDSGVTVDDAQVITLLKDVLLRRAQVEALEASAQALTRGEDVTAPMKSVVAAQRIGDWAKAAQLTFTEDTADIDALYASRLVERVSTGIPELDAALDGGLSNASLTSFVGETNSGKSQQLVHITNALRLSEIDVAYATLEMPVFDIIARVWANLTGLPTNAIRADRHGSGVDAAVAAKLRLYPRAGRVYYRSFEAQVATVKDLVDWVRTLERDHNGGRPIRALVVDYADEVNGGVVSRGGETNTYQAAGNVYAELYTWARDEGRWAITASQAQRRGGRGSPNAKLSVNDMADSMRKARRSDYVITLNPTEEDTLMTWFVAKARGSKRYTSVGPYPTEFVSARIVAPPW